MFARALLTSHRSRIRCSAATVAALAALPASTSGETGHASGQAGHTAMRWRAGKLTWMKGLAFLPAGAKWPSSAVIPASQARSSIELSFPNGYRIAPHSHPTAEKVTVKSGEFMYGMGDEMKASDMKTMKPGDSGELPANMHHYAQAHGKTVVDISSTGPFVVNYVHTKDDPRTKAR